MDLADGTLQRVRLTLVTAQCKAFAEQRNSYCLDLVVVLEQTLVSAVMAFAEQKLRGAAGAPVPRHHVARGRFTLWCRGRRLSYFLRLSHQC